MKVAVVTDTHFGFKNDSPLFLESYLKFFEDQFFPYLLKNNIKTVIHMGDVLDRRKCIRARYSPMTPIENNCIPEKIAIVDARNGNPATGVPFAK